MEEITIHLSDVIPFLNPSEAQRKVLRYLHDLGIEGDIGCDNEGAFIRYYPPKKNFEEFSMKLYMFITKSMNGA